MKLLKNEEYIAFQKTLHNVIIDIYRESAYTKKIYAQATLLDSLILQMMYRDCIHAKYHEDGYKWIEYDDPYFEKYFNVNAHAVDRSLARLKKFNFIECVLVQVGYFKGQRPTKRKYRIRYDILDKLLDERVKNDR